jgi:adenylate kinase
VKIMLLAPPGAGKGTQGARLAERFNVPRIVVGDLLRDHIRRRTQLGRRAQEYVERGDLVPDDIVLDVVLPAADKAAESGGFVLDGFPRTMPQALAAADLCNRLGISFDAVVSLDVPEEELVTRLLGRAKEAGRVDDTPEVIQRRLRVFGEQTAPLIRYYRERGILVPVNGNQPPDDVTDEIMRGIDALLTARSADRNV